MFVIGYTRLSVAREASVSTVRQRESIEDWAASHGHDLVDVVNDTDVSATKSRLDRPGLDEVRRRLARGEAEAVIVWRLDRLARNVRDVATLLEEGVRPISVTEPFDTSTPAGVAMVHMAAVFGGLEASATSARVLAAQRKLLADSRWRGGRAVYGYRPVPLNPGVGLEPDPNEREVVRRMVEWRLAGDSADSIARRLNADGVPTRANARWSPTAVDRITRSPALLGYAMTGGEYEGTGRARRLTERPRPFTDEHGLPVRLWEPIVTPEEHAALSTPRRAATNAGRRLHLVGDLVTCGGCGWPMASGGSQRMPLYRCASRHRGRDCAFPASISSRRLDRMVEEWFLDHFGRLEVVRVEFSGGRPEGLDEVEAALAEAGRQIALPGADIAAIVERVTWLQAERARLAALPTEPTRREVPTGHDYATLWGDAPIPRRRAMLDDAGLRVSVSKASGPGRANDDRVRISIRPDGAELPDAADEGDSRGPGRGPRRLPRAERALGNTAR